MKYLSIVFTSRRGILTLYSRFSSVKGENVYLFDSGTFKFCTVEVYFSEYSRGFVTLNVKSEFNASQSIETTCRSHVRIKTNFVKLLSLFNRLRRIESFRKHRSGLLCAFQTKYRVTWWKNTTRPRQTFRNNGCKTTAKHFESERERERERERMSKHVNFIRLSCGTTECLYFVKKKKIEI